MGESRLKERIWDDFIGLLTDNGNIDSQKAKAFDISGARRILGYEYEDD